MYLWEKKVGSYLVLGTHTSYHIYTYHLLADWIGRDTYFEARENEVIVE
jgi:hypothetical protein